MQNSILPKVTERNNKATRSEGTQSPDTEAPRNGFFLLVKLGSSPACTTNQICFSQARRKEAAQTGAPNLSRRPQENWGGEGRGEGGVRLQVQSSDTVLRGDDSVMGTQCPSPEPWPSKAFPTRASALLPVLPAPSHPRQSPRPQCAVSHVSSLVPFPLRDLVCLPADGSAAPFGISSSVAWGCDRFMLTNVAVSLGGGQGQASAPALPAPQQARGEKADMH